jgi:hypothetical protein
MMKKPIPFIFALLVGCFSGAAHTSAQTQTEAPAPVAASSTAADPVESADLAITADVTARELRFEIVPNTAVEFTGSHRRDTVWDAVSQTLNNLTQPNGLLSQTVNSLNQTVQRTVDRTGSIVERTLDNTGKVVNQRTVGDVSSLSVLSETTNNAGQTLRRVTDTSGAVIELTLDAAGKVINSRVVSQATGGQR